MKCAIAVLLVALSCCFDQSTATIQQTCLTELFQKNAPAFIQDLGNLLCKYQIAKKTQNQELFMEFLNGVTSLLADVGCTLQDLLGAKVVLTLENAEKIADNVAVVLFNFLNELLSSVYTVLNDLPSFVSDIVDTLLPEVAAVMNVLKHILDVKDVACDVLEDLLPKVAEILAIGGEILNKVINDLGLAEKRNVPVGV